MLQFYFVAVRVTKESAPWSGVFKGSCGRVAVNHALRAWESSWVKEQIWPRGRPGENLADLFSAASVGRRAR